MKIEWVTIRKALKTVTSPLWALCTHQLLGLSWNLKKVYHRSVWLRSGGRCGKEGWNQTWVSQQREPARQGPTHLSHLPPTESLSQLPCSWVPRSPWIPVLHILPCIIICVFIFCMFPPPTPSPNSIVSSLRKEGKYLWIQSLSSVLCYECEEDMGE